MVMALFFFSACSPAHKEQVDELNNLSYAFHYRNLDSTKVLAERALKLADDYSAGYAEACNNLAFVEMARMNYDGARKWLERVEEESNNQLELLIADVQYMRICQRESHNKDFYSYRERAQYRLRRIGEEADNLPPRERKRALYAQSEFDIVDATYFYYIGLEAPMLKALNDIDADVLEVDTAQYLNYLYNIGSGGAITKGTAEQIAQSEFDYLVQCYMLALSGGGYPYWQANALQAISEHLQKPAMRDFLIKNNQPAIKYLNVEQMPDSLLAGNLAQRALNLFMTYGDTYQIAGGYRTLSECYFAIHDYYSAGDCLQRALTLNKAISAAPDLVASIRERLSLVYSALDDKPKSDYNRNIYLDLQEQTRQDRQLEARAALLDTNAIQLNWMIAAVIGMIIIVILFLYLFDRMRRKNDQQNSENVLLQPLTEWKQLNQQKISEIEDNKEEIDEALQMARLHVSDNKRRNLEQRAKVSLVNSITPFIDRMIHEVDRLMEEQRGLTDVPQSQGSGEKQKMSQGSGATQKTEQDFSEAQKMEQDFSEAQKTEQDFSEIQKMEEVRKERYEYISELTDKINQYNNVLTQWIQMRQGSLNLRIESFPLQPLFDIVLKGKMGFQKKGITLEVKPTDVKVKADRTLTLFMINTIADNARKFTSDGGKVTVWAEAHPKATGAAISDATKSGVSISGATITDLSAKEGEYVEIVIADTGKGMDEEQLSHVFDRTYTGGHGFGLLNCKGIIEKYKKVSSIFSVCSISAESEVGKGSVFRFRLPKGISRILIAFGLMTAACLGYTGEASASPLSSALVSPLSSALASASPSLKVQYSQSQQKLSQSQQKPSQSQQKYSSKTLHSHGVKEVSHELQRADDFADSAYFSNINGTYQRTLAFADSSIHYLNQHYLNLCAGKLSREDAAKIRHLDAKTLMVSKPLVADAAEIKWFEDSVPTNYSVILDIRNESAVAALALHDWDLYHANNKVFTQLFRERSADNTLDNYVKTMQVSENSKTVAVILLILMLLQLPLAYYFLYYRHVLVHRYAIEKVNSINRVLLDAGGSDENEDSREAKALSDEAKLAKIEEIWNQQRKRGDHFQQLDEVVEQIKQSLRKSIENSRNEAYSIELAEDELHRVEYENDKLHIANSVLDNCLSTLKHETMYYPSRIRQLIDDNPSDVQSLHELVDYYKELYTMLSAQAMEQVASNLKCDADLLAYLKKLLTSGTGRWKEEVVGNHYAASKHDVGGSREGYGNHVSSINQASDGRSSYGELRITCEDVKYQDEVHSRLFTPLTSDMKYLVCRQIVREIGETTNLRGCGIQAKPSVDGHLIIEVVLPAKLLG